MSELRGVFRFRSSLVIPRRSLRLRAPNVRLDGYQINSVDQRSSSLSCLKSAIQKELNSLISNGTWRERKRLSKDLPLSTKWVFKIKRSADGSIERFKARLVVLGNLQRRLIHFDDTYAPVIGKPALRALLSIAAQKNLHLHQLDITTAFLNGKLDPQLNITLLPPQKVSSIMQLMGRIMFKV